MAKDSRLVIDIDELISNVQATTCLWDHNDPNYFKRDYQRVGWMEVADAMKVAGLPVYELKKRWRGLRDTFSRELRRLDMAESPLPLEQRSSWRHFSRLLFLHDVVSASRKPLLKRPRRARRVTSGETNEDEVAADTLVKREYCDADALDEEDANQTDVSERSSPGGERGDSLPMITLEPVHSYTLEQPGAIANDDSLPHSGAREDADAQFLLSLLPFLRDVPKKRKLIVRARLSQVLMDEQAELHDGYNHG